MNAVLPFSAASAAHAAVESARSRAASVDDGLLLARVLRPYKLHARYLRSAVASPDADGLVVRGELAIPESCYIEDTGHFNSVEFNICYNQMVYLAIAKAVQAHVPPFSEWSLEDFWRRQLSDILITRFESCFRRPVNARRFHGEVTLKRSRESRRAGLTLIRTSCRFWDEAGGECDGQILLALVGSASKVQ